MYQPIPISSYPAIYLSRYLPIYLSTCRPLCLFTFGVDRLTFDEMAHGVSQELGFPIFVIDRHHSFTTRVGVRERLIDTCNPKKIRWSSLTRLHDVEFGMKHVSLNYVSCLVLKLLLPMLEHLEQ